ncbi:hypothetical protein [Beijerinckia indica]|uniref:Uncharacterized protein n=1 Tax=Beijerinckia indica subsp. indica (strain ATCC 9039 / DSM 1715 / NCIMB 8712) TaxID=395963 RepID=B2IC21_BEII9|nr:hypothetical protein [Beijerinckia indica]ACB95276.1 hypothetical protein Bind_1645 [Beijerinckia indica subsp. indica ATCC 9039]
MNYAVLAVGFLMALIGLITAYHGYGIIEIERGWTAVIAGVVALSGGVIIVVLGLILRALGQIRLLLEAEGHMAALTRATPLPDDLPVRPSLDLTRPAPNPFPEPEPTPYQSFHEPEPAQAFPAARAFGDGPPSTHQAWASEFGAPAILSSGLEAVLEEERARAVTRPHEAEPERASADLRTSAADLHEQDINVEPVFRRMPEANPAQHHDEKPFDAVQRNPIEADEPEITPTHQEESLAELDEAPIRHGREHDHEHDHDQAIEPHPPAWPESTEPTPAVASMIEDDILRLLGALEKPIADEVLEPHAPIIEEETAPAVPTEPEPEPEPLPAKQPEPAAPDAPTKSQTIIGRYEADGTAYVMFSDGSIEAHSARGVARFKSMAELKAYMEAEAQ